MSPRQSMTTFLTVCLLAACQAVPPPTPGDGVTPPPGTAAPTPAALRPELRIATASFGNEQLDPIRAVTDNGRFLRLIFDPLIGSDYAGEEISRDTGVAEDWSVSDDGLIYTFQIRQGITFHNGEELTSDDVKFSLDRYKGEEAATPNTARISGLIDEITVLSPTELEVRLTSPSFLFLTLLSNLVDPGALIVPRDYFEEVGLEGFAQNPIGSGPYRLVERETGSHITVEKASDEHWAIGQPRFERVTLRLVPEEGTRLSLLRAGDVDFIDMGIDKVAELESEGFRIFTHNGLSVLYAFFQVREGDPIADENFRAALSHAINREELAGTILGGLAEPTGNVWPGVGEPIPPTPFDLDAARQLLAQTPYGPDGEAVNLQLQTMPREGWPQLLQLAQAVQDYWNQIGVSSTITYRDFGAFRTEWLNDGLPAPAVLFYNFDPQLDWHSVVNAVWTCEGTLPTICDQELDALHAEWGRATSMEEYVEGANAVERYLHDNYWVLPIVSTRQHFAGNDQVPEAYQPGDTVRGINIRALVWNP
jgi:ABC-type transport system substrate-binding protein